MKKILSVLLAVIMVFSALSITAFANDSFRPSYTVEVESASAERMSIQSVKYPVEKDADGNFVTASPYVSEGDDFHFIIITKSSYEFDQTTVVKVFPKTMNVDIIEGNEYDEDSGYGDYIYPDSDGVYTVSNVTEDMYIRVYNLQQDSLADIKDFLMNFANFFLNLFKWFFGLGK